MPHDPHRSLEHLKLATATRLRQCEIRRQLRDGQITLLDAFADPTTQRLFLLDLLAAQRGWGIARSLRLLSSLEMSSSLTVASLSGRRRVRLADAAQTSKAYCGARARQAA